jgi:hypothetical protein
MRATEASLLLICLLAAPAWAQEPLSAIDWLSRSVIVPPQSGTAPRAMLRGEPPVSVGAGIEDVVVTPLDGLNPQALGLIPAARSGLPHDIWGTTPEADLAALMRREKADTLPAIQELLRLLMLAELEAPQTRATGNDSLLLARVDGLLGLGALEPAYALLQLAGSGEPEHFRRLFDISLLLGEEDRACRILGNAPGVSPSYPARIFCLARGGDWPAAVLVHATARALGQLDPPMADLLERFLDPGLAETLPDLPAPERPTPLVFRMMEAIGQPLPTAPLPLAFAQADLRANTGWKARIEAAERLARMGSVDPNQLLGLYTERNAAASGGVWERVAAMARLDAALAARDAGAVSASLPEAQRLMSAAGLESIVAELFAGSLTGLALQGDAAGIGFRLGLLSEGFEAAARAHRPQNDTETFLIGVALGSTDGLRAGNARADAVKLAFDARAELTTPYAELVQSSRTGEALLLAVEALGEGARGDLRQIAPALTLLRHVGLESAARRIALQLLLQEPLA